MQETTTTTPPLLRECLTQGRQLVKKLEAFTVLPKAEIVLIAIGKEQQLYVSLQSLPEELRVGLTRYISRLNMEMESMNTYLDSFNSSPDNEK